MHQNVELDVIKMKNHSGKMEKALRNPGPDSHDRGGNGKHFTEIFSERNWREQLNVIFLVAFCVLRRSVFGGIDLTAIDRLIGVIVVGTGLPMVCRAENFAGYLKKRKDGLHMPTSIRA